VPNEENMVYRVMKSPDPAMVLSFCPELVLLRDFCNLSSSGN